MKTTKDRKGFLPFVGKLSQKLGVLALLACSFIITTSSTQAFDGDYSRAYGFGGVLRAPNGGDPVPNTRNIIDVNGNVEAGGVLGCSGLDLNALVDGQLGGIGNIGDLSKDIANAAKTRMFNEALTQLFSDPQVASVLEGMQGMAQARIGMLQKNCDANQIYADATNKRLRAEAMSRCVAERRSMEDCSQAEILSNYLEQVVESPRWSEDMHDQLCDSEEQDNCDWTLLLPNKRTPIDGESRSDTEEDPETPEDETPDDEDEDRGDNSVTDDDTVVTPAAASGEEVPPAINANDIVRLAYDNALKDVFDRVTEARRTIESVGYSEAMRAVLHDQPGIPPIIEEYTSQQREAVDNGNIEAEELITPMPYTFYQFRTNEACSFSFSEQNNFSFDLTPIIGQLPENPSTDDGGGETPPETPPTDPEPEPEPDPTPPQSTDGRGRIVFPVAGKSNEDIVVTSYYHQVAGRPAGSTKPHVGIDYRARNGENALAVYDGRVTHGGARHCGDVNLTRTIDGRTERFRYFHMRNPVNHAVMGRDVSAGTRVGTAGARCAGFAHLHVEYYVNGVERNPSILLGFSQYKGGGSTARFASPEDRRLAGSSLSGFSPALGENPHGEESLATTRTNLPPDHPFVIALQNQMDQLAIRISNTAKCMTNKLFHPQVYVKLAALPGKVGFVGDDAPVDTEMTQANLDYDLRGDAGAMISGIAQMIAYDAAIATYNASIMEMTQALAIKGSDGANGMNQELFSYARGHLALLKLRRSTVITDYEAQCELARTVSNIPHRLDDLSLGPSMRGSRMSNVPEISRLGDDISFDCSRYEELTTDGIDDLRKIYVIEPQREQENPQAPPSSE